MKKRCYSKANIYGKGAWDYHIKQVVENAEYLAGIYNADIEIVKLAALLHDVASVTDKELYKEHHIHGQRIAEELLESYNYPKDKIELIKKCILNHRGSIMNEKMSIEEVCIADADAMAHFDNIPSLYYLAYVKKGLSIKDGNKFVHDKLSRSYNKLSDKTKLLMKDKYENIINIF